MDLEPIIDDIGRALDAVGVLAIVIGVAVATLAAVRALLRRRDGTVYDTYRQRLGRSILLGLELLVAADIIETVAGDPTFESVGILGLIVLIRTFLSYTLEVELTGRWPWQPADEEHEDSSHSSAV
jgi:uncharacterized membrane protein